MTWAPDYITTAQLKSYLRIFDTDDDIELAVIVSAASRAIDDDCNRQFGLVAAPEARTYVAWYDSERCRWVVDVDDFMTTAGMTVTVNGVAATEFTKEPLNAAAKGRPWERLAFDRTASVVPVTPTYEVVATAQWGWTTVPVPVTLGARLQSSRFHSRRDSPYGIAGSPEQGSELRLLAKLDVDVAMSLRGFRRARRAG